MAMKQTFAPADADLISRVNRFLTKLMARKEFKLLDENSVLALTVLTTQGLASRVQVRAFLMALSSAQCYDSNFYVAWNDPNGRHRYRLSPLTAAGWNVCKRGSTDWDSVLTSVDARLARWYQFATPVAPGRRIDAFLNDYCEWLGGHLPEPLFEHVVGTNRMTPLPDLAWKRRSSNIASESQPIDSMQAIDFVAGTALSIQKAQSGSWFVDKVMASGFDISEKSSPGENMKRLAESLLRHTDDLQYAGFAEAIWFGWLLHIASFGSVRRQLPAASTLRSYLAAAPRIYHALRAFDQHPVYCDSDEISRFFSLNLAGECVGAIANAALVSFHTYLVRVYGIQPAFGAFAAVGRPAIADANVIWAHEFDSLPKILRNLTDDPRLLELLMVWHALFSETTLRISELAGLRIANLKELDGQILLEIVQPLHGARLKTAAARRQEIIRNKDSVDRLRTWLSRRDAEASEPDDLLFWREDADDISREFARAYQVFTRGLRLATGDSDVHIHHTRHSAATLAAEPLLADISPPSPISPVAALCARMGHADSATLFRSYVHLFENALQDRINWALSSLASKCLNLKPWISGLSKSTIGPLTDEFAMTPWERLVACSRPVSESGKDKAQTAIIPAQACDTGAKRMAAWRSVPDIPLVIRILRDVSLGQPAEKVILRANLPPEVLLRFMSSLELHVARLLGLQNLLLSRPAPNGSLESRVALIQQPLGILGLRFKRLSNSRWRHLARHFQALPDRSKQAFLQAGSLMLQARRIVPIPSRGLPHLLNTLREAGFRADQFALKVNLIAAPASLESVQSQTLSAAIRDFKHIYGCSPQVEALSYRRGRPECYFYLLTKPLRIGAPMAAATNDSGSLFTFALAAAVYADLEKGCQK